MNKKPTVQYQRTLLKRKILKELVLEYYDKLTGKAQLDFKNDLLVERFFDDTTRMQHGVHLMKILIRRLHKFLDPTLSYTLSLRVKDVDLQIRKEHGLPDINMPNTRIESIRNKIGEGMAHGFNAREILKELHLITRPELVRVIMDIMEHPVEDEMTAKAKAVKDILVKMAVDDKIPSDMNEIDYTVFYPALKG